jgi:hypothetical protein
MPVSKRRKTPPEKNRAYVAKYYAKNKALRIEQEDLRLEFVESLDAGTLGIKCDVSRNRATDTIEFDWTGPQSAYDAMQARCAEVRLELGSMIESLEQWYLAKWTAERKGKGIKAAKKQYAADRERVEANLAWATAELDAIRATKEE